jgi:arylsulfatase A-like enzyme
LEAKAEVVDKYKQKFLDQNILDKEEMDFGSRKHQNIPEYAAMVQHMDDNVGKILKAIDELGLRDNTIVVFTSDNGGKHIVTSNAPLRGAKHTLYEGGIRVPMIIRYPEQVLAGTISGVPLISDDLYPTLLQMASLPLEESQHLDGMSFRNLVYQQSGEPIHEALFWHYPHNRFEGAVRWNNFKLIYEYKTGKAELYNLSMDIGERNDIAKEQPEVVDKMKKMLAQWLNETNAKFPGEGIIMPG